MIMQIAFGIFFGFVFMGVLAFFLIAVAYVLSKDKEPPKFMKEPKKPKGHGSVKDWWDDYDEF